jgi:hypothetical protein
MMTASFVEHESSDTLEAKVELAGNILKSLKSEGCRRAWVWKGRMAHAYCRSLTSNSGIHLTTFSSFLV